MLYLELRLEKTCIWRFQAVPCWLAGCTLVVTVQQQQRHIQPSQIAIFRDDSSSVRRSDLVLQLERGTGTDQVY